MFIVDGHDYDDIKDEQSSDHITPQPAAATTIDDAIETGGPSGPEPTRFGDWERKGRCIDF